MSMDRREFVKSVSAVAGTAALAGLATSAAEADDKADGKEKGAGGPYEVFANNDAGPFTRPVAMTFFNTGYKDDSQIYYYIWAVRATECRDHAGGYRPGKEPGKEISEFRAGKRCGGAAGHQAKQVTRVVITHMHFDHVSGMEDFPKAYPHAKFYIQKRNRFLGR